MGFLNLLKRDPTKTLKKRIATQWETSMQLQRQGKIVEYAEAVAEAERLQAELDALTSPEQEGVSGSPPSR